MLAARSAGAASVRTSLDLGLTESEIALEPEGVLLPDGQRLPWAEVEEIGRDPDGCRHVQDGIARAIHAFSPTTQRAYSLLATGTAPTLINAGFTMHRMRRTDPWSDTQAKIRAAAPIQGRVLDTTTGLGYTAILAARSASAVTTIELDPTVLEIARLNPWSQPLFSDPRISRIVGDAYEEVAALPAGSIDLVIHDPPTLSLAGELYSGEFYRRLFRVLRPGGRLFHYIGNPESKQGAIVTRGVIRRLHDAGFGSVKPRPDAFGVAAQRAR